MSEKRAQRNRGIEAGTFGGRAACLLDVEKELTAGGGGGRVRAEACFTSPSAASSARKRSQVKTGR